VNYTDKPSTIAGALKQIDVLCQSSNQKMDDPQLRKALFEFADAGKGLVLLHPGLWYNWPDWPEYNRVLASGGAKSHDRYGEFEVVVKEQEHPILKGVPASFLITDELYHYETRRQRYAHANPCHRAQHQDRRILSVGMAGQTPQSAHRLHCLGPRPQGP
jgi:hypothetical protein